MPKTIRDLLKRWCAQSVNHMANAILDLNEVYVRFEDKGKPEAKHLEKIMLLQSQLRDEVLSFVMTAWALDEDQLARYI